MYFRLLTALAGLLMYASYAVAFPTAYITNLGDNTVSVIDTKTNTYVTKIPLGDGQEPYGVAVSSDGKKVYVSNQKGNTVSVIDALSNVTNPTVINTINLGSVSPRGLAINAAGTRLYVTNFGAASVSVFDVSALPPNTTVTLTALASPTVGNNPTGIAINPLGTYAYVTNFGSGTVSVIDIANNYTISGSPIPVGSNPTGIVVGTTGAAGGKIYVANKGSNSVSVIDASTRAVTEITGVGSNPYGIAVTPDGSTVYVTNALGDTVAGINTTTNAITSYTMPTGSMPQGIAVTPDGQNLYAVTYRGTDNKGSIATIRLSDGTVGSLNNQPNSNNPDFVNFFNAPHSLGNFIGPQLYNITTTAGHNGTVTSPEGKVATNDSTIGQIVKSGATAIYTLNPANLYRVNSIAINGTPIALDSDPQYDKNAKTVTLSSIVGDTTLDVTFIKDFDYVSITRAPVTGAAAAADGTVTSTVGTNSTINCSASTSPSLCNALFQEGASVTLTATPKPGYYFAGWVGDTTVNGSGQTIYINNGGLCGGKITNTCTFTMSTYAHFTATFTDVPPYDHIRVTTVSGTSTDYAVMQDAFNATNGSTAIVKLWQTPRVPHTAADLTTGASFTLSGGWSSPDCSSQSTTPTPISTLTITSGTITAEYIAIQ